MGIETSATLFPRNDTTVDGTGADIRVLRNAATGSNDETQTVQFTNANDNVERTFDPATGAVTTIADASSLQKLGWATRLVNDMTPTDDANCDAFLVAQTATFAARVNANQSGGTYASGTFQPTFKVSLWRYNLSSDTGTLIATGSTSATSWNCAGVGGDLGTSKVMTITGISIPDTQFLANEVLLLQVGLNTGTVPNPTLGTGTFTVTLRVDSGEAVLTFGTKGLRTLCPMDGTAAGAATVSGVSGKVLPTTGTIAGAATVAGVLGAVKQTTGTSAGVATVAGAAAAVKGTVGTAAGSATASGSMASVKGMVGTAAVSGGGTTVIRRPPPIFDD